MQYFLKHLHFRSYSEFRPFRRWKGADGTGIRGLASARRYRFDPLSENSGRTLDRPREKGRKLFSRGVFGGVVDFPTFLW